MTLSVEIEDQTFQSYLDNAGRDTAELPEERVGRCERQWSGVDRMIAADDDQPVDQAAAVPIIKDLLYVEDVGKMGDGDDPLYHEPLVADFVVVYVEDSEHQLAYLTESRIEKLNLSPVELRSVAVSNVYAKVTQISRRGSGPVYMLTAGGTFEASLLLLDEIWEGQAELVEGDVVVAAPSRDMVVFTGSGSPEGLKKVREIVETVHADASYLISRALLVRRDGKWRPFTD